MVTFPTRVYEVKLSDGSIIATGGYMKCWEVAKRQVWPRAIADYNHVEDAMYFWQDGRAVAVIQVVPREVRA